MRFRGEIDELKTKAKVFQDTKCSCCPQPLELPAVHFLCGQFFIRIVSRCNRCIKRAVWCYCTRASPSRTMHLGTQLRVLIVTHWTIIACSVDLVKLLC